ncbi:hypothetical protein QTJ16_005843 [Diplocarpon rosae]|uniref:USP domain-containing protein n=1 Tax=Diplocarpon rosae TaxID=946125 RepID=A0AAD9SXU4_9HELO|nr:hypothetical protein QTJ16_005843 [Diplocarpon rosae]
MEQSPTERAISSEPCSGRPNPFDDTVKQKGRKRQKISRGGSRSRSLDTARGSDTLPDSVPLSPRTSEADEHEHEPILPSTPTNTSAKAQAPEPTSSRFTINLRTTRALESISSSPPAPMSPSRMPSNQGLDTARISVESESDGLSTVPAIETPSSSPSAMGSPHVVLVDDEDSDFRGVVDVFADPMSAFPYKADDETAISACRRIANFFQFDDVPTSESFVKIREWIESYLFSHSDSPDTFYDIFVDNREFWRIFPNIIWGLNWRSRFFGNFLHNSQSGRKSLTELFVAFARLAGKFVEMDATVLSYYGTNGTNDEPELASAEFLCAYAFLLRVEQEPHHIGHNLNRHYNWSWDEDLEPIMEAFHSEGGTISNLTKLIEGKLKLIPTNPKMIDSLADPSRIVWSMVSDVVAREDDRHNQQSIPGANQKVIDGYDFFKVMSDGLLPIIEKHITCFSVDSAVAHTVCLSSLFGTALLYDISSVGDLVEESKERLAPLNRKQMTVVLPLEWKFKILHKLITSSQMQLRVAGVANMQKALLDLHADHKGLNNYTPTTSPILLFFASFILKSKLVDYLVGVGSHPEIIADSNNILGFLIVTRTYTSELTDKIWQTVMTSQDPRVVEAILGMMTKCLSFFEYAPLLYLCEKMSDVPVESFSGAMRDYFQTLIKSLLEKMESSGGRQLHTPPYDLCVRLIRESSVVTSTAPAGHTELQRFVTASFRSLLSRGPGYDARMGMYVSCIEDISSKSPTAPGSICVVGCLLHNNPSDLRVLTTEHGLTKLLVEELESAIGSESQSLGSHSESSAASTARRDIIQTIVQNEPDTISADLGSRLWDVLVGEKSSNERNISWQLLNTVAKSKGGKNVFIASCFTSFMPSLPPHCFTTGSLDFVREAISSWFDEVREDFVEETRTFSSPALEQLWRMILTSPPNTIDALAINILVQIYVGSALILSLPRTMARSIHLGLVNRCLEQLKGAASKLKTFGGDTPNVADENMVIVASKSELHEQELIFARSLAVLREFLRAYQAKPQFAPPKSRLPITAALTTVEGNPMAVKYQSFDGNTRTEVMSLTLGTLNTAATLFASLEKATGFKNYRVYCGGKIVDPEEIDFCQNLEDLNLKGLLLVHRREDTEAIPDRLHSSKMTLELEITKHFDDLWSYLSMNEKVAQEIYYFLIKFDPYERLLRNFSSDTPHSEIFLSGQPFKSLYAVHSLKQYISSKSQKGIFHEAALSRAISLLVAAISDPTVLEQCGSDDLRDVLALHIMECLLQFLRGTSFPGDYSVSADSLEPILPTSVKPYLDKPLLDRLLEILYSAKNIQTSPKSVHVTARSFEVILEASIHNADFWDLFVLHLHESTLLQDLILDDPHPVIRKNAMKHLVNKCTFIPSLAQLSTSRFVAAFWPMVAQLIPRAIHNPLQCEETFNLSLTLFKRLADTAIQELNLEDLVKEWSNLLLSHRCVELVGHADSVDPVAQGLTTMVFCATSFTKASQRSLSQNTLGIELFRQHLFPELSIVEGNETITARIPLLNPSTRRTLAETVYFLVKDDEEQYHDLLLELFRLVPYADEDVPYIYDMSVGFERSRSIRSQTDYVGLRNLSNTCYLNSLFTQLFMNVPFREFMLNSPVADGGASQKLLFETQNLFSYMQNSLRRFVDPVNLASSIRTYDETQIDVHVQMDVDEFYNLLFDRWESQILAPEAKTTFKSFFGGQLVQQVKSKECSHISERLESFSAIQCDIKGKSTLKQSLEAYVEGEVMEGDNKYKCSTCDRHVNAVKRACLKDVPDSLIFHLKRFDYNLRTMIRSKINDHFSFPKTIDMRPYKVDYLMNSSEDIPEDVFELVGVLVHSGTAESGHYYSFIRERPSTGDRENWVEFNDECVSPWDPSRMESACFGGPDYQCQPDSNNNPFDKSYSAYMLFYQRSSVLEVQKTVMKNSALSSPVRLPVPRHLSNHIAMENELLMRKYCLYDPSHAVFVLKMLSNIKNINGGSCSASHILEKLALSVTMHHLDQVFARTKDTPDFVACMLSLQQLCQSCAECSRDYLEWYCDHPEAMKQLLVRNPDGVIRHEIALSILNALKKVKADASYAYGFVDDDDSVDGSEDGDPQVIQRIVGGLNKLWDIFHVSIRAWPEYFGLLASIAGMGKREATLLLDHGFLKRSMEVICADLNLPITPQLTRMLGIMAKRVANRPVSYDQVITLMYKLLVSCDPALPPVDENRVDLALMGKPVPLSTMEHDMLLHHWTKNKSHILLEKLLTIRQNEDIVREILILLLDWPSSLDHHIYQAICCGLRKGITSIHAAPFIRAAATYCEESKEPNAVVNMVGKITKIAREIDGDNEAVLQFFKNVFDAAVRDFDMTEEDFLRFFFNKLKVWAPCLLTDFSSTVRMNTEEFIHQNLLSHGPDVNFGSKKEDLEKAQIIVQAVQGLGLECLKYCQEVYLRQRQQAVVAVVANIRSVIEACSQFFDYATKDPAAIEFYELTASVIPELKRCTVEEAEEEVSDWDNTDGEYDSEPMERAVPINDNELRL